MSNSRPNPYVGPRPFDATRRLPARKQEVIALRRTLIATRIVLLHAPSGAGKTSLIEAQNGLRVELETHGFLVRPTLRIHAALPVELAAAGDLDVNRYALAALGCLSGESPAVLAQLGLGGWLAAHPVYADEELGEPDEPPVRRRELLIFDQFEEILTLDPGGEAARRVFFDHLAAVLADPYRFALFVLREDYLGALEPWAHRLPTQLASRFRIDVLNPSGAREAIREPARAAGVRIDDDALDHLVTELSLTEVQRLDGTLERQPGLWVEPVVLQVVCWRLWSSLAPEAMQVALAEVRELGDVDSALSAFYAGIVEDIAGTLGLSERSLRDWIGSKLISPRDVRIQVMRSMGASEGLNNRAIEALEAAHLVRGEERRHVKWYELSHDRLVAPVRADNQRWQAQHLHPMQVQAALWAQRGQPVELLLSDEALAAAEVWAAKDPAALTEVELRYLAQSRDRAVERARVREAAERLAAEQARRVRQLKWSALVLAMAFVAAVMAGVVAYRKSVEARRQEQIAQAQTALAQKNASAVRDALAVAAAKAKEAERESDKARRQSEIAQAQTKKAKEQSALAQKNATVSRDALRVAVAQTQKDDPIVAATILRETASTNSPLWRQTAIDTLRAPISKVVLRGYAAGVTSVAFSPDGKKIVSGSEDNIVRIRKADGSGSPIVLTGHRHHVTSVAFSPDGKKIVSGSWDSTIRIWKADGSGSPIVLTGHQGPVTSVAFSPDGKKIVSGSRDNTIRIWSADASGSPLVLTGHQHYVASVAFSPDGKKIVSGSWDNTIRIWSADASGSPLVLNGHQKVVFSVAFSPDGKKIVSGSWDNTIRIWKADGSGSPLVLNGHQISVRSVAFSPDVHEEAVLSVAFSPDGKKIVSGSWDNTIRIWNADGFGSPIVLTGHQEIVSSVAFSSDGKKIVSGSHDKTVRIWKADGSSSPLVLNGHQISVRSVAFSPDGKKIVSGSHDKTVRIWNADDSGSPIALTAHEYYVLSVAFSSDGKKIISGSRYNTVWIWKADGSGSPIVLTGHQDILASVAFSPDGKKIVSGSWDSTIRIWNADGSGSPIVLTGHQDTVTSVAFSPGGKKIVSGSHDKTIRIWKADGSGSPIVLTGHQGPVTSVAFSPDGKKVVSGSQDKTVRIWNADGSGSPLVLSGHQGPVTSVAFSPDGKKIVSGSGDNTIRIWTIDGEALRDALWSATSDCLPIDRRESLLLETPAEAKAGYARCLAHPRGH